MPSMTIFNKNVFMNFLLKISMVGRMALHIVKRSFYKILKITSVLVYLQILASVFKSQEID